MTILDEHISQDREVRHSSLSISAFLGEFLADQPVHRRYRAQDRRPIASKLNLPLARRSVHLIR